jgi:hypothetical protein
LQDSLSVAQSAAQTSCACFIPLSIKVLNHLKQLVISHAAAGAQ